MNEVRQSLGEIPIVDDELRKAAGDEQLKDESVVAVSSGAGNNFHSINVKREIEMTI